MQTDAANLYGVLERPTPTIWLIGEYWARVLHEFPSNCLLDSDAWLNNQRLVHHRFFWKAGTLVFGLRAAKNNQDHY